jgi:hypothetical protein
MKKLSLMLPGARSLLPAPRILLVNCRGEVDRAPGRERSRVVRDITGPSE